MNGSNGQTDRSMDKQMVGIVDGQKDVGNTVKGMDQWTYFTFDVLLGTLYPI